MSTSRRFPRPVASSEPAPVTIDWRKTWSSPTWPVSMLLAELRAAGFGVAIGGFGSGPASLHVAELELDAITLDPSWLTRARQPRTEAVLRAVVALARDLAVARRGRRGGRRAPHGAGAGLRSLSRRALRLPRPLHPDGLTAAGSPPLLTAARWRRVGRETRRVPTKEARRGDGSSS